MISSHRSRRLSGFTQLSAAVFVSSVLATSIFARVTDAEIEVNAAKNLARMNCGAKIECFTPGGHFAPVAKGNARNLGAAALLMDDDTLSCPLQEGETNFIITLPATALLDRFAFLNENAAATGELRISVSNYHLPLESAKWVPVEGSVAFSSKRLFNLSMVGIEAKYVKLSFHVEKAGQIAALGLYGSESLRTFSQRNAHLLRGTAMVGGGRQSGYQRVANENTTPRDGDLLGFNFANLYAEARVVYVSSGAAATAKRMIDDDSMTGFRFAANDRRPTVIVELTDREPLHRVSSVYKMEKGRLEVFLLNELQADRSDLSQGKLIASVTDTKGTGKAAVDFDLQGARYVALRWTPDSETDGPFEIAEIHAFGDVPLSLVDGDIAPALFVSNALSTTTSGGPESAFQNPPFIPVVSP